MSIPCPVFARSWIPRHCVNFCRFWMLIRAIIKLASPLIIMSFGIFCYTKMTFGLKKGGGYISKMCTHSLGRSDQMEHRSLH
jgi:hypothetical protein